MRLPVLATMLLLTLAGCAAAPPPAITPPSTSVAESPTPVVTATPAPAAVKPPLGEIVIGHEGLGPVSIGTDLHTLDPATSIFANEPEDCGQGPFDRWRANYPERPLGNEARAFEVGETDGPLDFVMVLDEGPHTDAGVHVGSTLDQLLAAHPAAVRVSSGAHRDRYALYGSPANLFFDVVAEEGDVRAIGEVISIAVTTIDPALTAPSFHLPGPSCM